MAVWCSVLEEQLMNLSIAVINSSQPNQPFYKQIQLIGFLKQLYLFHSYYYQKKITFNSSVFSGKEGQVILSIKVGVRAQLFSLTPYYPKTLDHLCTKYRTFQGYFLPIVGSSLISSTNVICNSKDSSLTSTYQTFKL